MERQMEKRIKNLILNIRANERIRSFDEATTKLAIVQRLLFELGWSIFDAEEVKPEYSVESRRVDYSLRINNSNKVFLEVKKVTQDIEDHQKQLLDYSFQEGVKLAILANGLTWWFYLPLSEGSWEQRKYFAIDITQQDPEDIAKSFIDFLSRENVKTEEAIRVAETMLKGRVREAEIRKNLPKAWNKMVSEPDESLMKLINDTLEKICGHRAEAEQIVRFIEEHVRISIVRGPEARKPTAEEGKRKDKRFIREKTPIRVSKSFPPDETMCRFVYKGTQYNGIIKRSQLLVENFEPFTSFSKASREVTKTSRNGWLDWEIRLPGDHQWELSDTWRRKQRQS